MNTYSAQKKDKSADIQVGVEAIEMSYEMK